MSGGKLESGNPDRLGAHAVDHGVDFSLYSPCAERVELCLFDSTGEHESCRLDLPARTGDIWHGHLPGAAAGLLYGYRVHGPYRPDIGQRFNPNKLLLDPHARALHGSFTWHDSVFGHDLSQASADPGFDSRDSAPHVPKCRVLAPASSVSRPPRPRIPLADTILYEIHVGGFTRLLPDIPERVRGKLQALAEPVVIDHLRRLGVTTIELMPVAEFISEHALVQRGLSNFWGYNPIALFAVHRAYLVTGEPGEFARVVDRLHESGIEVVLDVVFNHTAEGNETGPTLAFRGLDNAAYYRLDARQPRRCVDFSGCGNTLDLSRPAVTSLVHDALRYWAVDMGVDGFRFDLAPALCRDRNGRFDADAPLLRAILGDPDLATLKLIVEPWDLAEPCAPAARFPAPFCEWNARFRDCSRRFWRGDPSLLGEFATRYAGSSDLFSPVGRSPTAGINIVTTHDGFTLADLLAYNEKHNQANGEGNKDGAHENFSHNGGVEGPTRDPRILDQRRRLARSLLATLLLSRGIPMLLGGDEFSRTQSGNNNAYCQDNATSWVDWSARSDPERDRSRFVERAIRLRRSLSLLREDRFPCGLPDAHSGFKEIAWLRKDGFEMEHADWLDASRHVLGILLVGHRDDVPGQRVFVAVNACASEERMRLPACDVDWLVVLDSEADETLPVLHRGESDVSLAGGGLRVFVPRTTPGFGVAESLSSEAEHAGILTEYEDTHGRRLMVPGSTLSALIDRLGSVAAETGGATAEHGSQPHCWIPAELRGSHGRWILSVQVYGLHSALGWGIGDFSDLGRLAEIAADCGASGLMLSPLHAPCLSAHGRGSPYSPSSRFFLNPLFISLALADAALPSPAYRSFLNDPDTCAALAKLRQAPWVDYAAVSHLKQRALRFLFDDFKRDQANGQRVEEMAEFARFRREHERLLKPYAIFEALDRHFRQERKALQDWPAGYRRPGTPEVEAFAARQATEVEFIAFMQWLAFRQWDAAVERARKAGMPIGFITDLALGAACDGAETWMLPDLVVDDMELGAPADAFSPLGQHWELPPWNPRRLVELDYQPYLDLLDAVSRGAGGLRIDHVMGLARQFWIPRGEAPRCGAYVRYPFESLLKIVARHSMSRHCMMLGEDLGNVPHGLRERLALAGLLGFRIGLLNNGFQAGNGDSVRYPHMSIAALSTHDLPTLHEYFAHSKHGGGEAVDRRALARIEDDYGPCNDASEFGHAAHRSLASSASCLAVVQLEDVLGMARRANRPELGDIAPNWRQRLPVSLERLAIDPRMASIADLFSARRRSG
jgi:glycogen debranching enzyme